MCTLVVEYVHVKSDDGQVHRSLHRHVRHKKWTGPIKKMNESVKMCSAGQHFFVVAGLRRYNIDPNSTAGSAVSRSSGIPPYSGQHYSVERPLDFSVANNYPKAKTATKLSSRLVCGTLPLDDYSGQH